MAALEKTQSMYIYTKSSHNSISFQGINCLSKAFWPNLEILLLCKLGLTAENNLLDSRAVKVVCEAYWPLMKWLNLSNNFKRKSRAPNFLCLGDWPKMEKLSIKLKCIL